MAKSTDKLQAELAAAEKKAKQIKQQIRDKERSEKAQNAKKERAQDNRRRYCLGGHVLHLLKQDTTRSYTAQEIIDTCKANLTRNVDRVAFGLEPLPKEPAE